MRKTFRKSERLKSRKLIEELFDSGKWLNDDPIRVVYKFTDLNSSYPAQAGVTVPKSNMKKAVDRNKFKRRMREAYRKNKTELYNFLSVQEKQCALMFIYKGGINVKNDVIEEKICALLQRLQKEHG